MSLVFHKSKQFNINPSKRFLGVEIEIAYMDSSKYKDLEHTVSKWRGVVGTDGSINSRSSKYKDRSPCDYEIKTAPANGDKFVKQILELERSFRGAKAVTNNSCGLHVHVDAEDLEPKDILKVMTLWSKIEVPMFSIISPRRIKSNWCRPWAIKGDVGESIIKKFPKNWNSETRSYVMPQIDQSLVKLKKKELHLDRYFSLNLAAISSHGTIENRMSHGTTNGRNIINWAILNASILDKAKESTISDLKDLPEGFDTLLSIAPTDKVKEWIIERKEMWAEVANSQKM
jgi:hypothetical protein